MTNDVAVTSEQIIRRLYKVAEDKDIDGWIAAMNFAGVSALITAYQKTTERTLADALGCYVAPFAYAQLQGLELFEFVETGPRAGDGRNAS